MALKATSIVLLGLFQFTAFSQKNETAQAMQHQNKKENFLIQSRTFEYSGSEQRFIVPAGVTDIHVEVVAASGGKSVSFDGKRYGYPGLGGKVETTIAVHEAQELLIMVGGAGEDATVKAPGKGGFNGGSAGFIYKTMCKSGGGGGASDIRTSSGALTDRLVVAGGGGASGFFGAGGNGGGLTGASAYGQGKIARGGTATSGGAGGDYFNYYSASGGSFGSGATVEPGKQGGGAGGGWYGGGNGVFGDGAGGSSYAITDARDVIHTQGYKKGNGYVILSWQENAKTANANQANTINTTISKAY